MLKKAFNVFTTLIVAFVVLVAASMLGFRMFGAGTYVVRSGSMEPKYHTGSLLYDKLVKSEDLQVGDPITFVVADDVVVTHRITEINEGEDGSLSFTTKGDANDTEDALPVDERNIIGKPVFSLPLIGYVIGLVAR